MTKDKDIYAQYIGWASKKLDQYEENQYFHSTLNVQKGKILSFTLSKGLKLFDKRRTKAKLT